jgi:hypothetical protein
VWTRTDRPDVRPLNAPVLWVVAPGLLFTHHYVCRRCGYAWSVRSAARDPQAAIEPVG